MPDLYEQIDGAVMAALHQAVDSTVYDQLTVNVVYATPPLRPGDWWFLDNGLPVPPPEPTPEQRALAILDPELRRCPLYDAGPPALRGPNWKA